MLIKHFNGQFKFTFGNAVWGRALGWIYNNLKSHQWLGNLKTENTVTWVPEGEKHKLVFKEKKIAGNFPKHLKTTKYED